MREARSLTKLCVTIAEKNTETALGAMRSLPPEAQMVELRLDAMQECSLRRLCEGRTRPLIVTNRPVREGGAATRPEKERLLKLVRAARFGAEYVDVELDSVHRLPELPGGTARIVSHHDFEGTPANPEHLLESILDTGPDVAKLCVTANDMRDVPPMLALLRRRARSTPLIALSMGEPGIVTRLLAPKFGAFLSFAGLAEGREAAPGQVPVREMVEMYRFGRLDHDTLVYGVVADPVAHSMSPPVHNAAFGALDINAVYLPFKVTDPACFLRDFEPYDLAGLSVTIPHKEAMLGLMDEVEPLARRVGAVNTVRIDGGHRYGCNTDVSAAAKSVEDAVERAGLEPLAERDVLLVGAGGAGRAIAYGLREKGVRLTIANRTVSRAQKLAAEVGAEFCGLDEMEALSPDIIINSTPVGMWPRVEDSPVPAGMLGLGMVVFDSVYNPVRTRLLREAEEAGAVTASGVEWFVNQAAAQFELWTGTEAPREVMAETLRRRLEEG